MQCVEVASVAISGRGKAKQAEQWEVGYIFPATELLSLQIAPSLVPCVTSGLKGGRRGIEHGTIAMGGAKQPRLAACSSSSPIDIKERGEFQMEAFTC